MMDGDKLSKHVFSTYINLRYGMAVIAAFFPLIVYAAGVMDKTGLQDSISAYYWASETGAHRARVWFVGGLFAVTSFLYLYKGFTDAENIALNMAALFGLGVAVFPTEWNCKPNCASFSIHGFCAVAMFACLVYVVWFRAKDTLDLLPAEDRERMTAMFKRRYALIGFVMLVSPLTAFVINAFFGTETSYVFFIECAGIWAFAYYWWVKSSEMKLSGATARALQGKADDLVP